MASEIGMAAPGKFVPQPVSKTTSTELAKALAGRDKDADGIDDQLTAAVRANDFASLPWSFVPAHSAAAHLLKMANVDSPVCDIIVVMDHVPTAQDVQEVKAHGFTVVRVFRSAIHGMQITGGLPHGIDTLTELKSSPSLGVTFIQPNYEYVPELDRSTQQIRARQQWYAYLLQTNNQPLIGTPNIAAAILDTGIDGTHPDVNGGSITQPGGKISGWFDAVGPSISNPQQNYYQTPIDANGHGTAVASIVAGTGAAGGIATGTGTLRISTYGELTTSASNVAGASAYTFPVDTTGFTSAGVLTLKENWSPSISTFGGSGSGSGGTTGTVVLNQFSVLDPAVTNSTVLPLLQVTATSEGGQPAIGSVLIPAGNPLKTYDFVASTTNTGTESQVNPVTGTTTSIPGHVIYSGQINTPMTAVNSGAGDGQNLMSGVAPGAGLVGVKALDDNGIGSTGTILSAIEYVLENKQALKIGVVNLSLGQVVTTTTTTTTTTVDPTLDNAVNNLVDNGVVVVVAAGNDLPRQSKTAITSPTSMTSPATASEAITVGATDPADKLATYTPTAQTGLLKPDVVAPGGDTLGAGDLIAADTNNGERVILTDPGFTGTTGTVAVPIVTPVQRNEDYFNDYQPVQGTSFAAAHVTGMVTLIEQALSITQGLIPGQMNRDQALFIKNLVLISATDNATYGIGTAYQGDLDGERIPKLGMGRINTDAALEGVFLSYLPGTTATGSLSNSLYGARAWVRSVHLKAGVAYTFTVNQGNPLPANQASPPTTFDRYYDLYLYGSAPSVNGTTNGLVDGISNYDGPGDPEVLAFSENYSGVPLVTGGVSGETITYTPTQDETDFLAVKRIAGQGPFTVTSTPNNNVTIQGTVTGADTLAPVPNASIVITETSPSLQPLATVTTAGDGSYSVAAPPGSTFRISISAPGYLTWQTTFTTGVDPLSPTIINAQLTPSHTFGTGLQLVSSPQTYGNASFAAIFNVISAKAAVWEPLQNAYVVTPQPPADTFRRGVGYWFRFTAPTTIQLQGISAPAGQTQNIALSAGWNMIGDPFNASVQNTSMSVVVNNVATPFSSAVTNGIVGQLYSYNSATNSYNFATRLDPYVGYWIYSTTSAVLQVPAP